MRDICGLLSHYERPSAHGPLFLMKRVSLHIMKNVAWVLASCLFASPMVLAQQAPPPDSGAAPPIAVGAPALPPGFGTTPQQLAERKRQIDAASTLPTPRTKVGHPDLTGFWGRGQQLGGLVDQAKQRLNPDGTTSAPLFGDVQDEINAVKQSEKFRTALEANNGTRPVYKPEFQAKALANMRDNVHLDPAYRCQELGVPRIGPPSEGVQQQDIIFFLYSDIYPALPNHYRIVHIDGRPHDPNADPLPDGDSVGHWEGDTLIVDTTNIDPDTWIDNQGSYHDDKLHVVERLTRKGNVLHYEVTDEDPTMFAEPFHAAPLDLLLGKPGQHVTQDYPCSEMDQAHYTN